MATELVHPLLPAVTIDPANCILGAMHAVAETFGTMSDADRTALQSTDRFIFGHSMPRADDQFTVTTPAQLAAALRGTSFVEDSIKFLTVMAFIERRAGQAEDRQGAGLSECLVAALCRARQGRSYAGSAVFRVAGLERTMFGHAFWQHFLHSNYAFPGDLAALNARFCVPHDSAHVLTGYGTSARGEILVSTFTASMHRCHPMAGHVLPVILSWHLKIAINDVARDASGALDPSEFWCAWAAGAETLIDTFAPDWDFWNWVEQPLAKLRARSSIPTMGLAA